MKDWILDGYVRPNLFTIRDPTREKLFNYVSSIFLWILLGLGALESMSIEFGITLKSILALGGVWGASAALAFKVSMENIISGLLLRTRDIFRIGDTISASNGKKGVVELVDFFSTSIRREDNSIVSIPNKDLISNEVVNWSRTPFRLFHTTLELSLADISKLSVLMESIETQLKSIEGIEREQRPVYLAATGFKGSNVQIEVELHFKSTNDIEIARLRTKVTNAIASAASQYIA